MSAIADCHQLRRRLRARRNTIYLAMLPLVSISPAAAADSYDDARLLAPVPFSLFFDA